MNKLRNSVSIFALTSLLILTLTACETQDDRNLEKARACTDNAGKVSFTDPATAATLAQGCDTMITTMGLGGSEATKLQFGLILLEQQKMSKIADMANALKNKTGMAVDTLNSAMAIMVFSDLTNAVRFEGLGNTLGGRAQMLGSLVAFSTRINGFASFNVNDPTSVKNSVANCAANCSAADKQAMADSLISLSQSACASQADQNSTDPNNMCYKMKTITGGSTDPNTLLNSAATYLGTTH